MVFRVIKWVLVVVGVGIVGFVMALEFGLIGRFKAVEPSDLKEDNAFEGDDTVSIDKNVSS